MRGICTGASPVRARLWLTTDPSLPLYFFTVNTSGNTIRDAEGALQLYTSVHTFARQVLAKEGWLIIKYFDSPEAQEFRKTVLEKSFAKVQAKKPGASRKESSEMYWICRNLKEP